MTCAIEIDRLVKDYGSKRVVDQVSLRVPAGCVYGFLGRNGAGKSTTLKMLLGMVRPTAGTAKLLGHDIAELPPEVRGRITYLAEGHPLYGWMTVKQATDFARAFAPRWNGGLVEGVLDHFELTPKALIRRLSKGQHAQVSLALGVGSDPDLLILDDPTLGLDTVVRRDFLESLIHLIQRQGRTILFSSHVLADVERVADRIGILVDGVLRVDAPLEHFREAVSQVVLEFAGQPPAIPAIPGLVNTSIIGRQVKLAIVGFGESHQDWIESLHPVHWDRDTLSLEDAFIAYTRGSRKPLPWVTAERETELVAVET
jgi:ABC-2 type transport system ATP-binding protein